MPRAAVGTFPYPHRTVREMDMDRLETLLDSGQPVDSPEITRLFNMMPDFRELYFAEAD